MSSRECKITILLEKPFSTLRYDEKLEIVKGSKPRPALNKLQCTHTEKKREYTRHFQVSLYDKVPWLSGSEELQKLFCWTCLLFSVEKNVWNSNGYDNLNNLTSAIQKHDRSQNHISCYLTFKSFGSVRIDHQLVEQERNHVAQHNEQVKKNRQLLRRMIDVVCFLAKQELPFRGHDESESSLNKGNYVETLQLISDYDPLLKSHLESATVFRGTSNRIQNDLIQAIKSVVLTEIKSEINNTPYVSIMLDETSDVMGRSQLSTVLRYVTDSGEACERFIGFSDVSADKSAASLYEHVVNIVEEFNLQDKLVAQGYDGAAVMSGHISGLCTRVQALFPRALFVHCYSHRLNLVLQQSANNMKECRLFFKTLSGLAAFFSHSPKRTKNLSDFMEKRLPRVAPTRWIFTSRLVSTVHEYRSQLLQFFEDIIDNAGDWDADEVGRARGYAAGLTAFDDCFQLVVFSKVFAHTDVLYNILQTKAFDIAYCYTKVKDTNDAIKADRNLFEDVWRQVLTETEGNEPPRKTRRNNETPKDNYRRFYYEILDNITSQLDGRFSSLKSLEFIGLLSPDKFEFYSTKFPEELFYNLKQTYSKMFDLIRLKNELSVLYRHAEF